MLFPKITSLLLLLPLSTVTSAAWPNGPFTTSGRFIIDASGNHVTYAGVNWPGAADTMIPEGLQYLSVAAIVSRIKSLGMNVIRLTYAIQMVDDIFAKGHDTTLQDTFNIALGATNGAAVLKNVLAKNPQFTATTTRLQVFDAIAAECARQQIYIHLDNHMSKAEWCCSTDDGNAWFGDTFFNVANWTRGLAYMATHGSAWPNLMSMSLRNELREPTDNPTLDKASYNWANWYPNIVSGSSAINKANPNVLIFLSGLGFDTDLSPIPTGAALGNGLTFHKSAFTYQNKLVLELHNYNNGATACSQITGSLYNGGFNAMNTTDPKVVNVFPVVLTEYGFLHDSTTYQGVYAACLAQYLPAQKAGWMIWVLAGSYYIRQGTQDSDESWGLLNHDWSDWRSAAAINNQMIPMVKATLA